MKIDRPHLEMFQSPKKIVLMPIGAIEQHGPRLPLDTDLRIAELLADRLENGLGTERVLRLPAIPFSLSWEHSGFPGMVSLSVATLHDVLDDVLTSIRTWGSQSPLVVVLVNWHGGNQALASIATELSAKHGLSVVALPSSKSRRAAYQVAGSQDVHAGVLETSIVSAFWPDLLPLDDASEMGYTPSFQALDVQTAMQGLGMLRISPSGVWGEAAVVSPDIGKICVERLVEVMCAEIVELLSAF